MKLSDHEAITEFQKAGFAFTKRLDILPYQYFLFFERHQSPESECVPGGFETASSKPTELLATRSALHGWPARLLKCSAWDAASHAAAGAACLPRPLTATTMPPMIEPNTTVQPIHEVIWGNTARWRNFAPRD